MVRFVRRYIERLPDQSLLPRVRASLDAFTYNNPASFKRRFLGEVGLEVSDPLRFSRPNHQETAAFVEHLAALPGECVFLLKDTWDILGTYQKQSNKGYGTLINRSYLCRPNSEEDYFTLIKLVYVALEGASALEEFLQNYEREFAALLSDPHWRERSEEIFEYVRCHHQQQPVIWVDIGFQYTFALFCYASVKRLSGGKIQQDFYNFTAYPWLQEFFEGKYFSTRSECGLPIELAGISSYRHTLRDRATGTLVGFAVGDALGYPAAGIDRKDLPRFVSLPIEGFARSPQHPYFQHLEAGQHTDNTSLLLLTAEHLVQHRALDIQEYGEALVAWYQGQNIHPVSERWAGPTAIAGIRRLAEGVPPTESGSTTTASCSCIYRALPLALLYRPFAHRDFRKLADLAEICGAVTHNSPLSRSGAAFVTITVANLVNGDLPLSALSSALKAIPWDDSNRKLLNAIKEAIRWSETVTDENARRHFGTGSPVIETVPLSIFYFLKYKADFQSGILAAANSFREDTPDEKARIAHLPWAEQLIAARGGNSDGIAALTGALLGAHLGGDAIPESLLQVENAERLARLSQNLVEGRV